MTSTDNYTSTENYTSNAVAYPSYVKVVDNVESDDILELPTEKNGTILLSTIQAQYPNATGLRYKSATGTWRGLRLSDSALDPPEEGWGDKEFFITLGKQGAEKRKAGSLDGDEAGGKNARKKPENDLLADLFVVGLTYAATEDNLKTYFSKFGELTKYEIKCDESGNSKGFGIIRYKTEDAARKVLKLNHNVAGRKCEVQLPGKKDEAAAKIFVGRLPDGTTKDDLLDYFSAYGDVVDIFMPKEFRGFGYVQFEFEENAHVVMQRTHVIKGACVNVDYAGSRKKRNTYQDNYQYNYNSGYSNSYSQGYGDMQQYGEYEYSQSEPVYNGAYGSYWD